MLNIIKNLNSIRSEENIGGTAFSSIRYHGGATKFHDQKMRVPHLMLVSLLISNASLDMKIDPNWTS